MKARKSCGCVGPEAKRVLVWLADASSMAELVHNERWIARPHYLTHKILLELRGKKYIEPSHHTPAKWRITKLGYKRLSEWVGLGLV